MDRPSRKRPRTSGQQDGGGQTSGRAPKRSRSQEPKSWGGEKEGAQRHRFGNYDRFGPGRWGDPRLEAIPSDVFMNARVLDVGCGGGYSSIEIAQRFPSTVVTGVDVDNSLICAARSNLSERRRQMSMSAAAPGVSNAPGARWLLPLSFQMVQRIPQEALATGPVFASRSNAASIVSKGMDALTFRHEDFVADATLSHVAGSYDIVLCLGVTKAVQLNWGDRGVLTLFRKAHACLRPGGRLILDAQPWESYRDDAKMSQDMRAIYNSLRLRPSQFVDFLLQRVGFRSVELSHEYRKPGKSSSSARHVRHVHVLVK